MRRVSIASSSQIAADAGAAIADQGGNAFDAAVAGVIASMCTEPGIIAPGAGGFMTVWPAGQDPVVIDGGIEMPGRGLPADRFGGGLREIEMTYGGGTRTIVGHGSVGTPGAFAGLRLTWERYGSAPWASLFEPAIVAVEAGFPLSSAAAEYFAHSHEVVFGWDPSSYAVIHHPDGTHMVAGDTVHVPHLADSLRLIGTEGTDALYRGELGAKIVDAVQSGGGLLTRRDLAEYEAMVRSPIRVDIDEWAVATNPPPAVGGACMAAMLMLLGGGAFESWSADDIQTLIRVQRAVLGYRGRLFVGHDRRQEAERLLELAGMGDLDGIISAPSTTHTSTVDSDGNACSVTVSAGYGSGALVAGTGFWLNNSLGELELNPQGVHSLEPGTRLASNMAPTVARSTRGA
ncbi:MAG: gamma-glutamyltransferase, partial [Acidimicrobiia bacterium]